MKKITFTILSILFTANALSANPAFRPTDIEEVKIEEHMYHRDGTEIKSLASLSDKYLKKEIPQDEHIEVGSCAMAHSDFVRHQESIAAEKPENVDLDADSDKVEVIKRGCSDKELISKKIYYNSHDGAYHSPVAVSFYGDEVTLEDGSVWQIASWDTWKTLNWLSTDTILVTQQSTYVFSSYKFKLVNQDTGKEVDANLALGPIYSGCYTRWIVSVDPWNDQVILNDGSLWEMSSLDYVITKNWLVNDTVIIGVNEAASSLRPNILINVNMLNYARGICLY